MIALSVFVVWIVLVIAAKELLGGEAAIVVGILPWLALILFGIREHAYGRMDLWGNPTSPELRMPDPPTAKQMDFIEDLLEERDVEGPIRMPATKLSASLLIDELLEKPYRDDE